MHTFFAEIPLASSLPDAAAAASSAAAATENSPLGWRLIIILLALFSSFFFSASEFVVIRLDRLKLREEAEEGSHIARILLRFLEDTGRFLSCISIGNTFANLLLSSFVAVTFAEPLTQWVVENWPGSADKGLVTSIATAVITVITTYVVLVFGELTPKQFAISKGEAVAPRLAPVLRVWSLLVSPIVALVNATSRAVLAILGVKASAEQDVNVNEEQILRQVEYGEEKGTIEKDEKEMIENVFDLNDLTAADVMVHRKDMVALPADSTPETVQEKIRETGFSRIPIYTENIDNIIGILNSRDLLLKSLSGNDFKITPLLRKAMFIPETVKADVLLKRMQTLKQSLAIVVDDHGGTSGVVSIEDLLEQIVGDLYDEYDSDSEILRIVKLPDGKWLVPGESTIDDVNAELETELVEGEFTTLGGYIIERLGSVPQAGTLCEVPELGLSMRVERMDGHRVDSVIIEKKTFDTNNSSETES